MHSCNLATLLDILAGSVKENPLWQVRGRGKIPSLPRCIRSCHQSTSTMFFLCPIFPSFSLSYWLHDSHCCWVSYPFLLLASGFAGQPAADGYADLPEGWRCSEDESGDENQSLRARGSGEWDGRRWCRSGLQNKTELGCRPVWGLDHAINKGGSSGLLA